MSHPYDERYEWHCSVCGDSVFALRDREKILNTFANKKMSKLVKLADSQHCLEDLFNEYTMEFLNKKHWIQLQYKVNEKKFRILVIIQIFCHNSDHIIMKAACYCHRKVDLHFLREYLVGLV